MNTSQDKNPLTERHQLIRDLWVYLDTASYMINDARSHVIANMDDAFFRDLDGPLTKLHIECIHLMGEVGQELGRLDDSSYCFDKDDT